LKTFDPRPRVSNLRLFVGIIFALLGFLTGVLVGMIIVKKSFIAIGVGTILFATSLLVRSEWREWKDWMRPYMALGSFLLGFAVSIAIFAVTREE